MKKGLVETTKEDFDSLPPALRRKLFSNLERFRLEQLRLAETDHHDSPNYRSRWSPQAGATPVSTAVSHQGLPLRGTSQRRGTPRTGRNSRRSQTRSWIGPPGHWNDGTRAQAPQAGSTFLPVQFKVSSHSSKRFPKRTSTQQQQKKHRQKKKSNRPSRRLRKPASVQVAYFVQQADSQWFRSLPPKIQQRDFSREEQQLLLTGCCDDNILDAADKAALYNKPAQPDISSSFFFPSRSPEYYSSETSSMATSDVLSDSNVTLGDSSLYDSLRWLDEDRDLDLTLDDYHAHVLKSAAPPAKSRRRRPSFARRLSLSSPTFSRTSSMTASNRNNLQNIKNTDKTPRQSNSSAVPPQTNTSNDPNNKSHSRPNPTSNPRPMSSYHAPRHISHGSTSSIDPSAQYYHDPEARLKLRVYLASPQKFDEAVEFGFPSLENKENVRPGPNRSATEPQGYKEAPGQASQQNDTPSAPNKEDSHHERSKTQTTPGTQPLAPIPSTDGPVRPLRSKSFSQKMALDRRSRPFSIMPKGSSNGSGINREMTLKMTLTRPDLRTSGSTGTASPTPVDSEDPLKLADLPPVDENSPAWKTSGDENGVMKKMWRRIKKYRS